MIRKLLIANRGEIACRIIRTCRRMGITTVAVFSDADRQALHVELADEAMYIGGSNPADSYLNLQAILDAVERSGADAVHPGYGFLAENSRFAYMIETMGLIFVGPRGGAIEAMGSKSIAKAFLHDVPLVPGYIGEDQSDETFIAEAEKIGFPIMVKASAGGGGKGMRLVENAEDLADALAAARREAQGAFGDATLMLEKALIKPRHIEVQIIGDNYGHIIALGERECSIQRRHQKVIEESPAYGLDPDVRRAMHRTAVNAAKQLGYQNAGTIEFLLDSDNNFYFMEMNTRLQVEHPVTEAVYAIDLVRWQIEVAGGTPLRDMLPPYAVNTSDFAFAPDGHAIEVRVYAEDPANNFLPVVGTIKHWAPPENARVDSGIRSGDSISTFYDPMIAKIISHGASRFDAIRRLDYALSQTQLLGLRNNIAFLRRTLTHDAFVHGDLHTEFTADHPDLLLDDSRVELVALIVAALAKHGQNTRHWRNNPNRPIKHQYMIGEERHDIFLTPKANQTYLVGLSDSILTVRILSVQDARYTVDIDGYVQSATVLTDEDVSWVHTINGTYQLNWVSPLPVPSQKTETKGSLRAPMPGQVIAVSVEVGQVVEKGDLLLIMEAMKMEHRIETPEAGQIEAIYYSVGDTVQADDVLVSLNDQNDEEPVS